MTDAARAFQALSDPTRLEVFECIRGCGCSVDGAAKVCACCADDSDAVCLCMVKDKVCCAPSTLSHHLNVLRDAGLIETERKGRQTFVRVRGEVVEGLIRFFRPPTSDFSPMSKEEVNK